MTNLSAKIETFCEFLDCCDITLWHFAPEGELVSSTGKNELLWLEFLHRTNFLKNVMEYSSSHSIPGLSGDDVSFLWLSVPVYDGDIFHGFYLIGPVFNTNMSSHNFLQKISGIGLSTDTRRALVHLFPEIPIIQHSLLIQYGLMLHRCITDKKIAPSDIQIFTGAPLANVSNDAHSDSPAYRAPTQYTLSLEIFKAVEDGNLEYVHPQNLFHHQRNPLSNTDPLRHAKNQMISCLTLITRAAIRGGLSENVAFQLGNYYVQSVESATNIAGVYQYSHEIFRDFTERVHKCKLEHGHSRETQQCLAYIETHVREKITLEDLATHLKYNKTYLSTKFSRETGMTLSECILNEKITLAKNLLKNTDKNITSISDELSFGSLSYFASQFRKKTGLSPSAYRNSH